ncbi:MAG: glycosyltransferase, partial [Flavobacterium sp.]|nr:glycosyltransferase [Pedobacter sp.]
MHNLAIVIPAYKLTFLEDALKSISSQANKNFTLYIGDDNSPDDLYAVVKKYEKIIDIVYKKFEENLGAITL